MTKYKHENIELFHGDCIEGIAKIPDGSIDAIVTDPPYLYLNNQKLDRAFDEDKLFSEFKRVLKPKGFVVMFGRGSSFYRWNTKLTELGLKFKEEIVWDKRHSTSPLLPLQRFHETISLHSPEGKIRKVRVPYMDHKQYDLPSLVKDIERIRVVFNNSKEMQDVCSYLETGVRTLHNVINYSKHGVTAPLLFRSKSHVTGAIQSAVEGVCERSIIPLKRDHHATVHPTQKPVRLMERLMNLVSPESSEITILDTFAGSGTTGIACHNTGRKFIGFEIDEEYYNIAVKRMKEAFK